MNYKILTQVIAFTLSEDQAKSLIKYGDAKEMEEKLITFSNVGNVKLVPRTDHRLEILVTCDCIEGRNLVAPAVTSVINKYVSDAQKKAAEETAKILHENQTIAHDENLKQIEQELKNILDS